MKKNKKDFLDAATIFYIGRITFLAIFQSVVGRFFVKTFEPYWIKLKDWYSKK
jgi:hypothetical protein